MSSEQNKTQNNQAIISYQAFIFNYQFQRKIPPGWYFFSKTGLVILFLIVLSSLFLEGNTKQYAIAIGVFGLIYFYIKSPLIFTSKLRTIDRDGWDDEKHKSLLLFSKLSWAQKRYYNTLNKKIIHKKGKTNE